jgi:VanZ family protein
VLATYLDCGAMTSPTDSAATRVARPGAVALAVVAVVAQLALLYWPVVTVEGPVSWTDKVVHLLAFAVPTYAVGRALRSVRAAVLVFAIHAPLSELVQHFLLPGRSGDVWDVVFDLLGVAAGAAALMVGKSPLRW